VSNTLAYRYQAFAPIGLNRFLRDHAARFDVAHLHACRNLPTAIAASHLARVGVPFVIAPNGTAAVIERRQAAKRLFDVVAGKTIMRRAARVLAVSRAETEQLQSLDIPGSAIREVPNPVDLAEFERPVARGHFRQRLGVGSEPLVLFLGRITPRKRVDLLVHAFARIARPHARLVVAGNDVSTAIPPLQGLIRIGLLAGRERLEALADADVVVYPSEHEIFGLVPLEALLCGTPVVVADDCGCGEVVREVGGGEVFAAGDVRSLAAAIDRVLDDADGWRAAAREASVRVRARFSAAAVCERLEAVYREVVR
jgi:glycosyltransferase involved in cell wall biosynthesis